VFINKKVTDELRETKIRFETLEKRGKQSELVRFTADDLSNYY
jgi:hypothetical protein